MPSDTISGRSGLSGVMKVGNIAELALDDTVAMRVRFDTPDGAAPPQSDLYFRGPVFGTFDGVEWHPVSPRPGDYSQARANTVANLRVQGQPVRYEVTLEPHQRPWLLLLDAAVDKPAVAGMDTFMTQDLQWLTTRAVTDVVRYKAESYTQFAHGPSTPNAALRTYTELPTGFNPRTLALAQQMRNDPALNPNPAQDNTEALVNAALTRLRTGGYVYTLEPGVYGQHTADEFWFDRKEGFCEHIASAFVVLMRSLHVPARVVTGYQGGSPNPVDGYWVVRQSDAHAWAEVWQEGRGWVRVDPTAAVAPARVGSQQRLQPPRNALAQAVLTMSPGTVARLRATWEALNNQWNQQVLGYDTKRQRDLLSHLGVTNADWRSMVQLLAAFCSIIAIALLAWALYHRPMIDPLQRLWLEALRKLRRSKVDCAPWETPLALAARVEVTHPELAAPVRQLVSSYLLARYGAKPTDLTALRAAVARLP